VAASPPLFADDCADEDVAAPPITAKTLTHQTLHDAKDIMTAPVRWRLHEWERFGEGLALVVAMYPRDTTISNMLVRNHSRLGDRYLHAVTHLGGGYGEDLTFAMIAGGYFAHDQRLMDTGIEALESSLFAGGIVTPAIKEAAGRARPIANLGKHSFDPFEAQSFPSGHSTSAFAIATAVASRYDDTPLVPAIAYTFATSVAIARVYDRAHFPSDVVAGALIGRAVAKSIVHNHVTVIPGHRALAVHVTF
jgi:hypothetical protein